MEKGEKQNKVRGNDEDTYASNTARRKRVRKERKLKL